MQLLHRLTDVLGVLGGLFALGILGFVILMMWASSVAMQQLEDHN